MTRLLGSIWFRAGVSVAILGLLVSRIDIRATTDALLTVHRGYLALALGLVGLDRLAMICRWVILLRASGQPVTFKSAAWMHMVSSFVGSALPAGIGADAARAYTLSQRTSRPSQAVASVAVDRVAGVISIAMTGAGGLLWWSTQDPSAPGAVAVPVALVTLVVGLAVLWADRVLDVVCPEPLKDSRLARPIMSLAIAMAGYRRRPVTLLAVLAVSLVVQLLRVTEAFLLGMGVGIDIELSYYLVFMPVGLLALLLPISVAGFGLPQGVIVWLLQPRGVPDPLSFALSTLIVLTGLAGVLPGAVLYARSKKA